MPQVAPSSAARTLNRRAMLLGLIGILATSSQARSDMLDRQLLLHASKVLDHCRQKGYQNVGVLKFRVQKGQSNLTDNVGPLNLDIANQLELALVLANRVQNPLGIIHDASGVAATIPDANHLVAAGREPLFSRQYPLAWKAEPVSPDAFLTGVVRVSEDLRRLSVGIVAFGRQRVLEKVVEFDADADPFDLIDAGESFLLRGALDDDEEQLAQVVKSANRVRVQTELHPLNDPAAPVDLEIRYDDVSIPFQVQDGQAFVREPEEGESVSFVLKRKQPDDARYGLVLKVNGLNTLYKERLPELECTKWVLEPELDEIALFGFQMTDDEVEEFKVLSKAASRRREMDYGADVGTVSLVVFREGTIPPPDPRTLLDDVAEDLAVLSRERFPIETPRNLSALHAQLRRDATGGNTTRGLITEGETKEHETRTVEFIPNPIPVMSVTITYYRAGR